MTLENLKTIFNNYGCETVYIKTLAANDNSKNQVYLGGNYEVLNIFPISEIKAEASGDWKRERFKANVNFSWITNDGNIYPAPNAQFILYPKYPEVRFSGFLKGCENPPSDLMTERLPGRLLFLSTTKAGNVIGYVCHPESEIANEISSILSIEHIGLFKKISINVSISYKSLLIKELSRIHLLGWINSKKLNPAGQTLPCLSTNCGGYTLEAELGITPNGYSEPDYLGYEIKQFKVANFNRFNNEVITLMTPEPTGGFYVKDGIEFFIRTYGYLDKLGRLDRMNFGGTHKFGARHHLTGLRLELVGFDALSGKIRNTNGFIALIDDHGNEAATWNFTSLLKHWNRKHNQACYIPTKAITIPDRKYFYGNNILLGDGTDFQLLLKEISLGNVFYDPGIKMESMSSSKPTFKRRSQFRIKSGNLTQLYKKSEIINLLDTTP